jgi:hypothetical protein
MVNQGSTYMKKGFGSTFSKVEDEGYGGIRVQHIRKMVWVHLFKGG